MTKRILLVDDDQEMCDELADILRDAGHTVAIAYEGKAALAIVHSGEYDAILLDLKLPGMSGLDVLESIRIEHKPVKVFILTGSIINSDLFDNEELRDHSGVDHRIHLADRIVNKPYDVEQILALIESA